MFKIVIVLMMTLNLYLNANNDFVSMYRMQGISAVEKELENSLKDMNYWKSYLEDKNVDLGYYEYKKYVILAQKEQSELSLYEKIGNDYKLVLRNSVIVGENQGDKYFEGDKKTPEGAYELIEKKTQVDQFYGPFALVTSYPNSFDMSLDKKGSGIWIHGMPFDGDREKFTKGCIALDNKELENLEKNIDYKRTVLLTSQNEFKKASKDDIALILSSIYKWKDAWKYSNIEDYLSFYSKDFRKSDKSNYYQFADYKRQIFSKNEDKSIKFSNIDISPYPNSLNKKMYKILMDEEYLSPAIKFYGKKELFVEIANNELKILAED